MAKKTRKSKWKWIILGIPIFFLLLGIGIVAYFGLEMTKQTALLAHSAVTKYEPEMADKTFDEAWPTLPSPGQSLGDLSFPELDLVVPVVQGTHEEELKKGAGHFAGSALPGQGGNVLLSGHRDTVFRKLENLEKGHQIVFATQYGDFVYEATDFEVVDADDMTVAVPTDYETLTLTTCYPFDFIGNAPERFVVYTKLVSKPNAF